MRSTHHCAGVKYYTSYAYKKASYYVKAVPSTTSETQQLIDGCQETPTSSKKQPAFKNAVLKLPDEAQWEIQRLTESREKASSNDNVKREWNVIALQERPRRKISPEGKQKWWNRGQKPLTEWVMVLRGETVDHLKRVLPTKHEDPWKVMKVEPQPINMRLVAPEAGCVPRPIVKKSVMTQEEAEQKMAGVIRVLFQSG